jgi:toxin ParE1/3/4
MSYRVVWTKSAEHDVSSIADYIATHGSMQQVEYVVEHILGCVASLTEHPEVGGYPPELATLGVKEFRQLHWKPYRILYRLSGKTVYIMLVADGRRDMQTLLAERLLA